MGSGSEIASAADKLPLPLSNAKDWAVRNGADFSFAGLKTAVRQLSTKALPPPLAEGEAEEEAVAADRQRCRADLAAGSAAAASPALAHEVAPL